MNNKLYWKVDTNMCQKHHHCLPSPSMRAIIIGESGCGKTTLLLNLLLQEKWLDYNNLIICGKSLHQPEYRLLDAALSKGYSKKEIRKLIEEGSGNIDNFIKSLPKKRSEKYQKIHHEIYDCGEEVPDPREINPDDKNVIVFDDLITESNQNLAGNFYTRGRHNNVSCIYISQSYHMLPRQTIRSNSNCLILFKMPNKDLRHIHDDIIGDMTYKEFNDLCQNIWQKDHGYIIINRNKSVEEGKYIANFQQVYIPQKYLEDFPRSITGKGLVNKLLQKLPLPEMHLSLPSDVPSEQVENGSFQNTGRYSFCGPGTKLDKRLSEGYKGVNSLDEACRNHDIAYSKYKKTKDRNRADDILAQEASKIALDESKAEYERKDARLVTGIMGAKSRFGMGILEAKGSKDSVVDEQLRKVYYDPRRGYTGINDISQKTGIPKKDVEKWLESQETYTLHKPIRHRFPTRRVIVNGIDDQWQADLVEMRNHKDRGYNYILTVIDVFSKYAWAVPVKRKTGEEISNAFEKIFKERTPTKLHTDKGLEFINKPTKDLLKKNDIHWFATENETKAQVVERFNRTLKNRMWKWFTAWGKNNWIEVLPNLVYNYNNTKHRSIGMTPKEASLKKNENTVYKKLFPSEQPSITTLARRAKKPKFAVGDQVRITVKRGDFRKGYRPNFTRELFTISKVLDTEPVTYRIKDLQGEEIKGSFYEQELVRVTHPGGFLSK